MKINNRRIINIFDLSAHKLSSSNPANISTILNLFSLSLIKVEILVFSFSFCFLYCPLMKLCTEYQQQLQLQQYQRQQRLGIFDDDDDNYFVVAEGGVYILGLENGRRKYSKRG